MKVEEVACKRILYVFGLENPLSHPSNCLDRKYLEFFLIWPIVTEEKGPISIPHLRLHAYLHCAPSPISPTLLKPDEAELYASLEWSR
jgi:hypothetical protein